MHDHGPALSGDAFSPEAEACPFTLVELPCGCQDVRYACGYVDREHDHVDCDLRDLVLFDRDDQETGHGQDGASLSERPVQ